MVGGVQVNGVGLAIVPRPQVCCGGQAQETGLVSIGKQVMVVGQQSLMKIEGI